MLTRAGAKRAMARFAATVSRVHTLRHGPAGPRAQLRDPSTEITMAQDFTVWKGQSPGHFGRSHRGRHTVRS
ncbi:hypothetical protein [Nocardia tengchongensis]